MLVLSAAACEGSEHGNDTPNTQVSSVEPVRHYRARAVEQRPQERRNFVQGLEIDGDRLLVSSGLYGASAVRVYDWPSMTLRAEQALPANRFAEGITRVGDTLYLLTWRSRQLLALDATSLEITGSARLPGEGWGITHHGTRIYFSDGSARLFTVDLAVGGKLDVIHVSAGGQPVSRLNELEWIDGEIWANVWQSDRIVRIDPTTGQVVGDIDASGLLPSSERQADTDVLNGIAYDPATGAIWLTGKRWPWLYRIELEAKE